MAPKVGVPKKLCIGAQRWWGLGSVRVMNEQQEKNIYAIRSGLGTVELLPDGSKSYQRGLECLGTSLLTAGMRAATNSRMVYGELVVECMQDLLRQLRLEDAETCPVQDLLGKWRVISTDLIPIMTSCEVDNGERSLWGGPHGLVY